jgi:hypothetical protein
MRHTPSPRHEKTRFFTGPFQPGAIDSTGARGVGWSPKGENDDEPFSMATRTPGGTSTRNGAWDCRRASCWVCSQRYPSRNTTTVDCGRSQPSMGIIGSVFRGRRDLCTAALAHIDRPRRRLPPQHSPPLRHWPWFDWHAGLVEEERKAPEMFKNPNRNADCCSSLNCWTSDYHSKDRLQKVNP